MTRRVAVSVFVVSLVVTLLIGDRFSNPASAAGLLPASLPSELLSSLVREGAAAVDENRPRSSPGVKVAKSEIKMARDYYDRGHDPTITVTRADNVIGAREIAAIDQAHRAFFLQQDTAALIHDVSCEPLASSHMVGTEQDAVRTLTAPSAGPPVLEFTYKKVDQPSGETLGDAVGETESSKPAGIGMGWNRDQWHGYGALVVLAASADFTGQPNPLDETVVLADGKTYTLALFYYAGACLQLHA
jgi:hypothetical protein